MTADNNPSLDADVLVIGGGLAGAWAAVSAARSGAQVVLAEKGYFGTSGVAATAGPGHWWVSPDDRAGAIRRRMTQSFGLGDPEWMARIIDLTWRTLPTLAPYYDFSVDGDGVTQYRGLRGPEYMAAMRRLAHDCGVRILDQSPSLELLVHADGSVAGARLFQRQSGSDLIVRAGAVVLATGGCAFLSRLLGSATNTGDGYLMAAEAGADFSGMEFCAYHTVSPSFSTMTRSMSYAFATYSDAGCHEIEVPQGHDGTRVLARALLGGPVYCNLGRMPEDIREVLPNISPNFMLPFTRSGIDPFNERFEVTLRGEGTIRGVGGLRVLDLGCGTSVEGLYAAGDVASRENVAGATSGGGAQNSAWALSSGQWAGAAAADRALTLGRRERQATEAIGSTGLRARHRPDRSATSSIAKVVRDEMHPFDKIIFRSGAKLSASRAALDDAWSEARGGLQGEGAGVVRARETAATLATARWCLAAAEARTESRGMHDREDFPDLDPSFEHRIRVGGLEAVWARSEAVPAGRGLHA